MTTRMTQVDCQECMMHADLDAGVIYTYEEHFMQPLLETLRDSAQGRRLRLILVDNASADADRWSGVCPQTAIVRNTQRLGYAENLNRILQASTAPYILLLNTDMYFSPDEQCLGKMLRFMDEHPQCGLSACRLYHPNGTYGYPARRFQNLKIIAARRLGLERWLSDAVQDYFYQEHAATAQFPCDWVSGCFMLIRREAYQQVGLLDEGFRKYFEDVDYCLRMQQAGWSVLFNGETFCYHWEQRASHRLLSRDGRLHLQSYLRFLRKWGWEPSRIASEGLRRGRVAAEPMRRAA